MATWTLMRGEGVDAIGYMTDPRDPDTQHGLWYYDKSNLEFSYAQPIYPIFDFVTGYGWPVEVYNGNGYVTTLNGDNALEMRTYSTFDPPYYMSFRATYHGGGGDDSYTIVSTYMEGIYSARIGNYTMVSGSQSPMRGQISISNLTLRNGAAVTPEMYPYTYIFIETMIDGYYDTLYEGRYYDGLTINIYGSLCDIAIYLYDVHFSVTAGDGVGNITVFNADDYSWLADVAAGGTESVNLYPGTQVGLNVGGLASGYTRPWVAKYYNRKGEYVAETKNDSGDFYFSADDNHAAVVVSATKVNTRKFYLQTNANVYYLKAEYSGGTVELWANQKTTIDVEPGSKIRIVAATPVTNAEWPLRIGYDIGDGIVLDSHSDFFDFDVGGNVGAVFVFTDIQTKTIRYQLTGGVRQLSIVGGNFALNATQQGVYDKAVDTRYNVIISGLGFNSNDFTYPLIVEYYDGNAAEPEYSVEVTEAQLNAGYVISSLYDKVLFRLTYVPKKSIMYQALWSIDSIRITGSNFNLQLTNDMVFTPAVDTRYPVTISNLQFDSNNYKYPLIIEYYDGNSAEPEYSVNVTQNQIANGYVISSSYDRVLFRMTYIPVVDVQITKDSSLLSMNVDIIELDGTVQSFVLSEEGTQSITVPQVHSGSTVSVAMANVKIAPWHKYPLTWRYGSSNSTSYSAINEGRQSINHTVLSNLYRFSLRATAIPHFMLYLQPRHVKWVTIRVRGLDSTGGPIDETYQLNPNVNNTKELSSGSTIEVDVVNRAKGYGWPGTISFYADPNYTTPADEGSITFSRGEHPSWMHTEYNRYIVLDMTEHDIAPFTWWADGSDADRIKRGKSFSANLPAESWNRLPDKIDELLDAMNRAVQGGSDKLRTMSGNILTAALFNAMRTVLHDDVPEAGELPPAVKTGDVVKASYFQGVKSLKSAINNAIEKYKEGS